MCGGQTSKKPQCFFCGVLNYVNYSVLKRQNAHTSLFQPHLRVEVRFLLPRPQ